MVKEMRHTFIGAIILYFQISYKLTRLSTSHLYPTFLVRIKHLEKIDILKNIAITNLYRTRIEQM